MHDYSATLGRFIELDPIGFDAGDNNWYRFVGNGPTGKVDPSGLQGHQSRPAPGKKCKKELRFVGHGIFGEDEVSTKGVCKGKQIPGGIQNGIGGSAVTADDIAEHCDELCDGATLVLVGCGIGNDRVGFSVPGDMRV